MVVAMVFLVLIISILFNTFKFTITYLECNPTKKHEKINMVIFYISALSLFGMSYIEMSREYFFLSATPFGLSFLVQILMAILTYLRVDKQYN